MPEHLSFAGIDVVELAEEYGTPLYVVDEDEIRTRMRECRAAFDERYERARTHYASKALLTKDILRLVKEEGLGLDVVSGGELYGAMLMQLPPEHIVLHGNNKTRQEIAMALDYGVGRFVCDSECEIDLIAAMALERGVTASLLLRVTPGVDSHTHRYISTGHADSKFGVPLPCVASAVKKCASLRSVQLKGFHFHVGSQLLENTSHVMATDILLSLIRDLRDETGYETEELGLGGGFGVRYTSSDPRRFADYFIDPMVQHVTEFCDKNGLRRPDLTIEPGRWIVCEAGITLYTVGSVKEIPGLRKYVSVDGGMTDNPRPSLYQAHYEASVANKFSLPQEETVTIAGRCCESGDILIEDIKLPRIEPGDIIVVKSTGAYCYSMASNYNKLPVPAMVAISGGKARLSVRRQSYEDLYERDL